MPSFFEKIREGFALKGKGWELHYLYHSGAMTPFLTYLGIVTFFCFFIAIKTPFWWILIIWAVIALIILLAFIITLSKNPNLMMTAGYNLERSRLESKLGQMNKPLQIEDAQIVYQPQRKTISAKARITQK